MDALRNAFSSQKKRRLSKGGNSNPSRRSTSPPPPDSGEASTQAGNLLTHNPNESIPYPFSAQFRLDASMKTRERKLRNFVVLTPIFPDLEYFRNPLFILDELEHIFISCGFRFIFGENPGVFDKVVREFMYSFSPKWGVAEIGNEKVRYVKEWKFRLGSKDFVLSSEDLRRAFGLESRGACLPPPRTMRNDLWRMITKSDKDYKSGGKTTQIRMPLWKFIHRLVATCIYLRKDGGRFVTAEDLDLMTCLHAKLDVDPLVCITRTLEEPTSPTFRGTYISGGHFVSMIARFVGFSLNPTKALPSVILGENELISRGLIKRVNMSGCWVVFLADSEDLAEATRPTRHSPQPSPHPDQAGPSTTHHQSSDYDEVLRRLDSLSTSAREFAAWQNDMTTWQTSMTSWHGDMMRGLYTNLGYSGYTSPPRPSLYHSSARDMPATDDIPMYDDFVTDTGMDTTFARAEDDDEEEEDAKADDGTDDSSDDEDDQEDAEATASIPVRGPDQYQLVYRRRSHN